MTPPPSTSRAEARRARQHSLQLSGASGRDFAAIAAWHGALQSQDYSSGLWSLGVRAPGTRVDDVQAAFERGDVLRTWPMRGTIHTIRASDARWLLDLTGVRALASTSRRREQLGLDVAVANRAADLLATVLAGRRWLSRKQALELLGQHGIDTSGQRGYHLLFYAAQVGRTCIGPTVDGDQTFVNLDDWAPDQLTFTRPEALAELVFRFFRSHGPATEQDFAGWSGLTLGDTRAGLAANDGRLLPLTCDGASYWADAQTVDDLVAGRYRGHAPTIVLPGFDEFILGFKDRTLQLAPEHFDSIVPGGNGMFRATVCVDGQVVGAWTRRLLKDVVAVDVEILSPVTASAVARIEAAFDAYAAFLQRPLRLTGVVGNSP